MPLTPADWHNVAFKNTPTGKRGDAEPGGGGPGGEADKRRSDARHKAEGVPRGARAKGDAVGGDARQRHQEAMGGLDAKRSALQKHIEELKQFEREYRTRLRAYLESQLRDLEGRGQGLETDMTRTDANRAAGSGNLAAAGLSGSYPGRAGIDGARR